MIRLLILVFFLSNIIGSAYLLVAFAIKKDDPNAITWLDSPDNNINIKNSSETE